MTGLRERWITTGYRPAEPARGLAAGAIVLGLVILAMGLAMLFASAPL